MKINKENYGRFIVDYYDGQLSPEEEQRLLLFLDRHPALKEEFENFEGAPMLPDEPLVFSEKQILQKPEVVAFGEINEDNYPEYFVLSMDNELNEVLQNQLDNFLKQNPKLNDEYTLFGLTKVTPDTSVVFGNKEQLRKRRMIPLLRYAGIAAAAMLLLLFGIRFFFSSPGQNTVRSQLALESIPLKSTEIGVVEISPRLIPESKVIAVSRMHAVPQSPLFTKQQPVAMLASADIYRPLKVKKDYAPLRFPDTRKQEEIMALSLPVVVEKPERNGFLRHTFGKPFSQLAAVLAIQKKKRKASGTRDKGFVKVLQGGVEAINALTDNDVVMVKTYDANGKLIDYQLLSDNFSINRPVKVKGSR
jgi:hypothetical protein